ncbi:Uncharacterised protein [Burkholderia pseudomallei]|nr:Uncharacterised protein [Burkholderia pseudomallei]CAJ3373965.1 Uncharacterised protein [Burkholderia pseudomallei]CAJ8956019.1 Uncharacterised protein [Burkholderia pseudomallei]
MRLREELARVFQKVTVHHAEGYIELFIKGRAESVWLPLDFVSLEPPSEPSAEQLEAAERERDALSQAMSD